MAKKILEKFKAEYSSKSRKLRVFLKKFDTYKIPDMDKYTTDAEVITWKEIDCTTCANCCKVMTPTFSKEDVKRISAYFNMSERAFKSKWLKKDDESKDWINKTTPCQFLDVKTNLCGIYDVRPDDCRYFPHFKREPFDDNNHVYAQNIKYCPATLRFIDILNENVNRDYKL